MSVCLSVSVCLNKMSTSDAVADILHRISTGWSRQLMTLKTTICCLIVLVSLFVWGSLGSVFNSFKSFLSSHSFHVKYETACLYPVPGYMAFPSASVSYIYTVLTAACLYNVICAQLPCSCSTQSSSVVTISTTVRLQSDLCSYLCC